MNVINPGPNVNFGLTHLVMGSHFLPQPLFFIRRWIKVLILCVGGRRLSKGEMAGNGDRRGVPSQLLYPEISETILKPQ